MRYNVNEGDIITYPLGPDEYVLFNIITEELLVINEQAYQLWEKLKMGNDITQFVQDSGFSAECSELIDKFVQKKFAVRCENA